MRAQKSQSSRINGPVKEPLTSVRQGAAGPIAPLMLSPALPGLWSVPPVQRRVYRSLRKASIQQNSPPQEIEAAAHGDAAHTSVLDQALNALIRSADEVMAIQARQDEESFEASHGLIFNAYRFLKTRELDPERHERLLDKAGIKQRKNSSLAKRSLRLGLCRAGYAKPTSTEHDWADWLKFIARDGTPLTLEAVKTYRTELAVVGGKEVKGQKRLDALRAEVRSAERDQKLADEQQQAAERECGVETLIQEGLGRSFASIDWEGDSEDHTTGLDFLAILDGKPLGMTGASETARREFLGKHGLRR